MNGDVTHEEIIKFVYGELSFSETADLYDKIDLSKENQQYLETCASLKFELDNLLMSPSQKVVENILSFSANY